MLRPFLCRQQSNKPIGQINGINHLILSISRMYITPFKSNFSGSSIEVLELQLSHFTAIHCISPLTTELFYIEFMSAFTDFFVRIETDTDFSVFDFRVFFQIGHCRNNLCNTGLIISTEQSFSVGYNQIFSFMIQQFRELRRGKNHIFFSTKYNIRTVILFYNTRSNILTRHIRTCIHVSNKPDSRHLFIYIGRERGEKITMLIQSYIFQPQRFQLFFQVFCKNHLFRSTWSKPCRFIRLRIEAYIL